MIVTDILYSIYYEACGRHMVNGNLQYHDKESSNMLAQEYCRATVAASFSCQILIKS
jgi:hypothetical protein